MKKAKFPEMSTAILQPAAFTMQRSANYVDPAKGNCLDGKFGGITHHISTRAVDARKVAKETKTVGMRMVCMKELMTTINTQRNC